MSPRTHVARLLISVWIARGSA